MDNLPEQMTILDDPTYSRSNFFKHCERILAMLVSVFVTWFNFGHALFSAANMSVIVCPSILGELRNSCF